MCKSCEEKKAAAAAAAAQSLDELKASHPDMFATEPSDAENGEYPELLYSINDYMTNRGEISAGIFPCVNCGRLVDHASETCSCWDSKPPMTRREQIEKIWQVTQWLAEFNLKAIMSGKLVMFADIQLDMPNMPPSERIANIEGYSFRFPKAE